MKACVDNFSKTGAICTMNLKTVVPTTSFLTVVGEFRREVRVWHFLPWQRELERKYNTLAELDCLATLHGSRQDSTCT